MQPLGFVGRRLAIPLDQRLEGGDVRVALLGERQAQLVHVSLLGLPSSVPSSRCGMAATYPGAR